MQNSANRLVCSVSLLQQRHSARVFALSALLALWQCRPLHFESPRTTKNNLHFGSHGHDFWKRLSFALRSPGSQTLSPKQWLESCKRSYFLVQTWKWCCGATAHRVKGLATSCDPALQNGYKFCNVYGLENHVDTTINVIMGSGFLGVPNGFREAGLLLGPLVLLVVLIE